MRLAITLALAVLLAGCATRDMDECHKGDRSRCPGEASGSHRSAAAPGDTAAPLVVDARPS